MQFSLSFPQCLIATNDFSQSQLCIGKDGGLSGVSSTSDSQSHKRTELDLREEKEKGLGKTGGH